MKVVFPGRDGELRYNNRAAVSKGSFGCLDLSENELVPRNDNASVSKEGVFMNYSSKVLELSYDCYP